MDEFCRKSKQLANQMSPPKTNYMEYVTKTTLEIMKERGKRKQEFIELKKQQETMNAQEQKLKANIGLNKMDDKVEKAIAEDKDSWIQQNTDEIRMAACEGNNRRVFEVVRELTLKQKVREKFPQQKEESFEAFYKILKKPRAK